MVGSVCVAEASSVDPSGGGYFGQMEEMKEASGKGNREPTDTLMYLNNERGKGARKAGDSCPSPSPGTMGGTHRCPPGHPTSLDLGPEAAVSGPGPEARPLLRGVPPAALASGPKAALPLPAAPDGI